MNTNTQALREALERIKSNLMHTRRFGVDDLGTWRRAATQAEGDIEELLESHPPAPEQPSGEHPVTLTDVLQKRCYEWGTYWRSSDAHGVKLNTEQALELLRDALGVEVEIAATPTAEPAVEAVPKGWKLVPVEPSSDMLDRAVAFALMSVLTGDYKWSQYMTDLWGRFLSAVPAAPKAAKPAYTKALEIRTAQGWKLTGEAIPVLYTDTINDQQVMRDDVWLCTTAALRQSDAAKPEQQAQAGDEKQ